MQRVRLPKNVLRNTAIQTLLELAVQQKGVHIYLVGGAVRDLIVGKKIADIDVVVTGIPYKKLGVFLASRGSANTAGDFGTIKYLADGEHRAIDVALPRTEQTDTTGARTGFRVQFDETLPIEDDLGRRDFTMNAMAIDLVTKQLIDPFGGQKDIAERVIRTVGAPEERFAEDYTRLLRAFRFACELDAEIEHHTRKALKAQVLQLTSGVVPEEMIAIELSKALVRNPGKFIDMLETTGIGRILLPELMALKTVHEAYGEDVLSHTRNMLVASQSAAYAGQFTGIEQDPSVLFALLFHDLGKVKTRARRNVAGKDMPSFNRHAERSADIAQVVWERLKLAQSGASRSVVLTSIAHHMLLERADTNTIKDETLDHYFLARPGEGLALQKMIWCDWEGGDPARHGSHHRRFAHLQERLTVIRHRGYKHGKPFALVRGEDIMRICHVSAGEELGEIIQKVRQMQITGKLATPGAARTYLAATYGNTARTE